MTWKTQVEDYMDKIEFELDDVMRRKSGDPRITDMLIAMLDNINKVRKNFETDPVFKAHLDGDQMLAVLARLSDFEFKVTGLLSDRISKQ